RPSRCALALPNAPPTAYRKSLMSFAGASMASSPSNRRVRALPVAVFALGLAITAVGGSATRHQMSVLRRQRFEARVVEARTEIDREVTSYAETLYGLRSLFPVEADVSRAAFHEYLTRSDVVHPLPAARLVTFARVLPASER